MERDRKQLPTRGMKAVEDAFLPRGDAEFDGIPWNLVPKRSRRNVYATRLSCRMASAFSRCLKSANFRG